MLEGEVAEHAPSCREPDVPSHVHVDEHGERVIPRCIVGDDQLEGVGLWMSVENITYMMIRLNIT